LLATSEKDFLKRYTKDELIKEYSNKETLRFKRRYYPFDNHLIFWTGDFNNTRYFWNADRGYIAERRHLAELRGFQNRKPNKSGEYEVFKLEAKKYKLSRFLPEQLGTFPPVSRYDYSELTKSLKAGIHSGEAEKLKKKQKDIHLTVDARLQTEIQNAMSKFFNQSNYPAMKKLRASVVVLNAQSGELLCSANYPLPNLDTLKRKPEIYNDVEGTSRYKVFTRAYTDMDLGISFSTPPGSTAKVISALAGLKKEGISATNKVYNVDPIETIYSGEPGSKTNENVTMKRAIVESSNIYFINLVNDLNLYEQLKEIYLPVGIGVDGITPYVYENAVSVERKSRFVFAIESNRDRAIPQYEKHKEARAEKQYRKMNNANWGWAWGQGTMTATPLAMARAYSIIANKGNFVETKYVMGAKSEPAEIVPSNLVMPLAEYMEDEAKTKGITGIAAKTGTPERVTRIKKSGRKAYETLQNDGWFVFFRNSDAYKAPVTVAIRIERLDGGGSQRAVYLAKDILNVISKRESEIKK
jgi:cell division protein FtsI/penicillin-binding protein 2